MYFPSLFSGLTGTIILLAARGALASPLPLAATENAYGGLEKRATGGLYFCTAINFTGTCHHETYSLNTCHGLSSPYLYAISSIGPDASTLCQVYYDTNCKDSGSIVQQLNGVFVYPGVNDLRTVNWNDAIGSFKCQYFNDSGEKK